MRAQALTRRDAHVWNDQSAMTNLNNVSNERDLMDQLRVKIALKVMRKAHVHGSRSDRERVNLEKATRIEAILADKRRQRQQEELEANRAKLRMLPSTSDEESEQVYENGMEAVVAAANHKMKRNLSEKALRKKRLYEPFHYLPEDEEDEAVSRERERQQALYRERKPLVIRNIDEISKDAKVSFTLTRDRLKLQQQSEKYGKPKPICKELIQTLKMEEFEKRLQKQGSLPPGSDALQDSFSPNHLRESTMFKSPQKSPQKRGTMNEQQIRFFMERPHLAPKGVTLETLLRDAELLKTGTREGLDSSGSRQNTIVRPQSASILVNSRRLPPRPMSATSTTSSNALEKVQTRRVSKVNAFHTRVISSIGVGQISDHISETGDSNLFIEEESSTVIIDSEDEDKDEVTEDIITPLRSSSRRVSRLRDDINSGRLSNSRKNSNFQQRKTSESSHGESATSRRQSISSRRQSVVGSDVEDYTRRFSVRSHSFGNGYVSSSFNKRSIADDERIQRVLERRQSVAQQKEDQLLQKINKRESQLLLKAEKQQLSERQHTWSVLIAAHSRFSLMHEIIAKYRVEQRFMNEDALTCSALIKLRRMWPKALVRYRMRKNSKKVAVLIRQLLRFRIRMILRRKQRAAGLIFNFLRDSTGISETMLKIYSFRQYILKIQKWFRKWHLIQIYRIRLLWMATERSSKERQKNERLTKLKNERKSLKTLSKSSDYGDTMRNIQTAKRSILHLLKTHEAAHRAKLAEEQLHRDLAQAGESGHTITSESPSFNSRRDREVPYETPSATTETTSATIQSIKAINMLTDRVDPTMKQWFRRVKSSPMHLHLFQILRRILLLQRRRHFNYLFLQHQRRKVCPVDDHEIRQFLRNPFDNSMAESISLAIGNVSTKPIRAHDLTYTPFLLLTMGGLDAIEIELNRDKSIKL